MRTSERANAGVRVGVPLLEAGPFSAARDDGRTLYRDVVVRLPEGGTTVLEGPSGAGKSTLLRQIAGLSGDGRAGRTLDQTSYTGRLPAWRSCVTLLAQDAPMLEGSVEQNLCFPFRQRAADGRSWDEKRMEHLLGEVGLDHLEPGRTVATLSGGERHRLALVRALLWDPPVLLADEPLTGLDEPAAASCLALLLAYARRPGHAGLVILHDRRLVGAADHRLRLANGRLEG